MTKNSTLPYFLFIAGLFFCLISSSFLTEGMFTDGLFYSVISHKISIGQCSFWHLKDYSLNDFYSHPPLALQMQSCLLSTFGDNTYCDKIYSVLTYIIVGIIICLIWKKTTGEIETMWMPLFFWITTPLVTWGATNNMLENTMSIFITTSILLCLFEEKIYLLSSLAGFFVFLAFMVKGPTALFPLSFPLIQFFFQHEKKISHYVLKTILMSTTALLIFSLMLLFSEDALSFFTNYYHSQINVSFNEPSTISRLYIVKKWCCEMLIGISIIVVGFIIKHRKQTTNRLLELKTTIAQNNNIQKNVKSSLKFCILGLCGVLPIMISLKQRSYYIIPTLPFFAIAMALVFKHIYNDNKINSITKHCISYCVFLIAITLNMIHFGTFSRDKELLHDLHVFEDILPRNEIVRIPQSLSHEYSLHEYFSRYLDIKLSTSDDKNKYMIIPKEESSTGYEWLKYYKKVEVATEKYNLYSNRYSNSILIDVSSTNF